MTAERGDRSDAPEVIQDKGRILKERKKKKKKKKKKADF